MTDERGKESGTLLSCISGRARLTLLGFLTGFLLTLGFLLVLNAPVQAFVGKGSSCSSSGCHVNTNASSAFNVSVNGSPGTAVTVGELEVPLATVQPDGTAISAPTP